MSPVFLTAKWLNLIMVNYEIDPSILKPYIPAYTELDNFNGIYYASLVGFLFTDTKMKSIAVPFHRTFEEINLRFYVRQKENEKWKRGVVFLREIVSLPAITLMANLTYNENYRTHKTKHVWNLNEEEWNVEYYWRLGKDWNFLKVAAGSGSIQLNKALKKDLLPFKTGDIHASMKVKPVFTRYIIPIGSSILFAITRFSAMLRKCMEQNLLNL